VVDWIRHYANITEVPLFQMVHWVGVGRDKFYNWQRRHGIQSKHNGLTPRHFWLQEWEKQAIISVHLEHQEAGC